MILLGLAVAVGSAGPAAGAKKCKPGVHKFDGSTKARTFCGPASAKAVLAPGKTAKFKRGNCETGKKYLTINLGTIVLGETHKKLPEYFGITVGQTPAGGTPAPKDGTYDDAVVAFVHGNKRYGLGNASVTLTNKRTRGSFTGELTGGGTVSGTFRCK
jgi:hypothetical protein